MKFWWANKVYNPQVTLTASLGFRIWQPLPMFTSWFCHDILWNKVQLCLQIGYTVILHSLSWFLCKDNFYGFFFFFFKYFMSFLCQNIRHFNFILLLVQWDCNLWSYITISAWELSILSLTSNQDIIGFPNQSKAFTNSKQNIWIFLIAGNVGSGWQLCMLRNFHWTFSLKWLYLKSELTMLHTCFLITIYSRCTRCILTEFSFIYGVV